MEKTLICTKKLQIGKERSYSPGEQLSGRNNFSYLYGSEGRMNGCLSKHDQQVCSKRTPCDHRSNLKKTTVFFSQKHNLKYLFWLWTQNVQNFFKFFRQGCENRTPCFQKNILKKKLLCKKLHFYIFSWFCWEFLTWRKTPWSSRRHSTWPGQSFGEEFLGEHRKFLNFVEWAKFSVFWRNSFSRVVKTAFRVSRETLWEKWTFPRKKYDFESIFWLWVKNFLFWPKTSPGVSKGKSTCPKTVLNKLPEKNQFYLFLRSWWRIFWVAQKLGFCQQGLLRLQRNISRKHFLKEKNFFLTFRLWTRIFRVSGKTKLTDLPKLHSLCPEIHFQKTDFFSKKT